MGLRRDEQTDALFRSILSLKSIEECYCYFEDLCTNKEVRDFGQRLEIAKELELGRPYPERELNQVLLRFHQDYCTLRRDMISEGILCREEGLYTRLV